MISAATTGTLMVALLTTVHAAGVYVCRTVEIVMAEHLSMLPTCRCYLNAAVQFMSGTPDILNGLESAFKVSGIAKHWDASLAKGLQEALKLIRTAAATNRPADIEHLVAVMQDSQYSPVRDLIQWESDKFGRYAASCTQISDHRRMFHSCRSPIAVDSVGSSWYSKTPSSASGRSSTAWRTRPATSCFGVCLKRTSRR